MVQSQGPGPLRIGDVAKSVGVSVDAVRLYERRGLLPLPVRTTAGYRTYDASAVRRIEFARRLQAVGLTLSQIAAVLAEHDAGASCSAQMWRGDEVLSQMDARIDELIKLRARVQQAVQGCRNGRCTLTPEGSNR